MPKVKPRLEQQPKPIAPAKAPPELSDEQLLELISQQQQTALEQLYQRFSSRILHFAQSRLAEPSAAADIVHETMLEVWRSAGKFEARSKASTWILGIARFKCLEWSRKHPLSTDDESILQQQVANQDDSTALISRAQDHATVQAALASLPAKHREILHLVFFEELSYRSIAELVDCPEGTVKSRVYHAKRALAHALQATQTELPTVASPL